MYTCNVDLTHSFLHLEYAGKMIFLTGLSSLEVFVGLSITHTTFEDRRDINFKSNMQLIVLYLLKLKLLI